MNIISSFLILYFMNLIDAKTNTFLVLKNINLDKQSKLRLMELGLLVGTKILIKHKSLNKKSLLINFSNSCFTIGYDFAKNIEVEYA